MVRPRKEIITSTRTSRWRARSSLLGQPCALEGIEGMVHNKMLHVHHKDANPMNNDPANLVVLCSSHHMLVEHGRIDLENPVAPPYYISASGRLRYRQRAWRESKNRKGETI